MMNRRHLGWRTTVIGAAVASGLPVLAFAADPYPTRPIRVALGFSAGTAMDVVLRVVADRLQARLG